MLDAVFEIVGVLCRRDMGIGDEVQICRLQGAVELNEQRGRIISFSKDTLRYDVKLNDTNCYKSVKSVNLMLVESDWVNMVTATSLAAEIDCFTRDEVGEAIEHWEALGVMDLNQDRTKVRFVAPFFYNCEEQVENILRGSC